MSKFIKVTELRYGDELLLNLDNIVAVPLNSSGTIYTNAVHGEGNGNFTFSTYEMRKIVKAIEKYEKDIEVTKWETLSQPATKKREQHE